QRTTNALALHHPTTKGEANIDPALIVAARVVQSLREASAQAAQLIQRHRLLDALEFDTDRLLDLGKLADALERLSGEENLAAYGASLDPCREVDCGADHRVLGALLRADVAHHYLAGVHTDSHLEPRPCLP